MAKKKKLPSSVALRVKLIFVLLGIAALVFHATSFLLFFCLMPTIAAALIDRSPGRCLTMSVGVLNLAGCTPFLLELWGTGHTIENAVNIAMQARTIIIVYLIAGLGYVIDFTVTGIVSNIMVQRAHARLKSIEKEKKDLTDRWGLKVNGKIPLDEHGFPAKQE